MSSWGKKTIKISLWTLLALLVSMLMLPLLLYIPPIQNYVKNVAVDYVNSSTGLDVRIDRLLLKFPLDLQVDGVLVREESQDTMIYAKSMCLDVKMLPLLDMDVRINKAQLDDGIYKMTSEDSSMVLRARVKRFDLIDSHVDLNSNEIDIYNALLDGGDVKLAYYQDKVKPTPPDSVKTSWKIKAKHLRLSNVRYQMEMLPYIKDLETYIGVAELFDGDIDTEKCKIEAKKLSVDSLDARYYYPTPEYIAKHPVKPDTITEPEEESLPWSIHGDSIMLTNSHAIYAMDGARPTRGLDMNFIEADKINFTVADFFNRGMEIRVPIKMMRAKERCGIEVTDLTGTFSMDSLKMRADRFDLKTILSEIKLDAELPNDYFDKGYSSMWAKMNASVGLDEVGKLYPSLNSVIRQIPRYKPLKMQLDVRGTSHEMVIRKAVADLPNYINLKADGRALHPMDMKRLTADVTFKGQLKNANFVKPMLLDRKMQKQVAFPPLNVNGKVHYAPNDIKGNLAMSLNSGKMLFDGKWNGTRKSYSADVNMTELPLHAILPLSPFGNISAVAKVKGAGYDIFSPKTAIEADVVLNKMMYGEQLYNDVTAHMKLLNGRADIDLYSKNDYCDMQCTIAALLKKDHYVFDVNADVNYIDLMALKLSETESKGQGIIKGYGEIDLKEQDYDVVFDVENFNWTFPDNYYYTPKMSASILSNKESVIAKVKDNDFNLDFKSECGIDSFIDKIMRSQAIAMKQIEKKSLNIDTLQQSLPRFTCDVKVGRNNIVQQYLASTSVKFKDINLNIANDSTIYMKGKAEGVVVGETKLDTITLYANERRKNLVYNVHIGNRRGTNDEFASVTIRGGVKGSRLAALLEQKNIKGKTGFRVGVNAVLSDTAVNVNFFPKKPIIGYRQWEVNDSNIVAFNYKERHFDANLALKSDSSYLSLQTLHAGLHSQEDVLLKAKGIQLEEWLRLSPFAPPITGELGLDMKLKYDGHNFWGDGVTNLKNLCYDGERVGDFDLKMNLELDPVKNCVTLNSNLGVDGKCSITAVGSLNDSTSTNPYNLNVKVSQFPLSTASAFMPSGTQLEGTLNGVMDVTGTPSKPNINGYIYCEKAAVKMPVFGSSLYLPETKLMVDSSRVKFDHFKISGTNKNAIDLNGILDMRSIDNPYLDITARGRNIEFVNSKQNRKSELFGKGYANVNATVKGYVDNLDVDANVSILPTTNITYILQTDVSTISTQTTGDMVKFVSFTDSVSFREDSTTINRARTSGMKLDAKLNIQRGSKFNVFLSQDGKDRVHLEGDGDLDFSQSSLGDMRLTGRYTINSGYVRYTPPLLSEKLFNIDEGSYVAWTGDLMNPILKLSAVETLRANVTQEGQDSRLINFLITLNVTNTLSNMGLSFDLSTNDDLTVQNELQSMSQSQRSNQAINLLLYETYTGPNTTSSSNLSGNPLFSFVNSQLNKWAANTIKGIDLTLGINQYDQTKNGMTTKTTSYSYKLSKSLFNDRFKIVIGGSYNPEGDNGEDFAQGLLNDISFVYMLNSSGTMSIKFFRHTGFASILEGEITEMGGAFVMRRKVSSLKRLFMVDKLPWIRKDENKEETDSTRYPVNKVRKENVTNE